eukprot:GHVN01102511.1.p1 GENE.GHVN01102511.1~~GHVN01102511.1.p1  ORF type:complete len:508 (+),score=53.85 GHVN01102511.1:5132-6655(+)
MEDLCRRMTRELLLNNKRKASLYAEMAFLAEKDFCSMYFAGLIYFHCRRWEDALGALEKNIGGISCVQISLFGFCLALECIFSLGDKKRAREWMNRKNFSSGDTDYKIAEIHGQESSSSELAAKIVYMRGKLASLLGEKEDEMYKYFMESVRLDPGLYEGLHELFYKGLVGGKRGLEWPPIKEKKSEQSIFEIYQVVRGLEPSVCIRELSIIQHIEIERLLSRGEYIASFRRCHGLVGRHGLLLETAPFYIASAYCLGDVSAMYAFATRLVDVYPEDTLSWYAVGVFNMMIGRYEESLRYLSKSLKYDEKNVLSLTAAGHVHSVLGANNLALSAYRKASKETQISFKISLFLGMEEICIGDTDAASKSLVVSLGAHGDTGLFDPVLLNEIGILYYRQKEHVKSLGCFQTALEGFRKKENERQAVICIQNTCLLLMRLGRFDDAEHLLLNAQEDVEKYFKNTCLGFISERKERYEDALEFYHRTEGSPCSGVVTMLLNPLVRRTARQI